MSTPRPVNRRQLLSAAFALPVVTWPALGQAGQADRAMSITRLDPRLDAILDVTAPVEILGSGYRWSEGPVWIEPADGNPGYLLFSDVPANVVHRWQPDQGVAPFLAPSGYAGPLPPGISGGGSNGLGVDARGRLILADSGNRSIVAMDLATQTRTTLADGYRGKRFNSPNDVAIARDGAIYFTDPTYGLTDGDASPLRELGFKGVFRLDPNGDVALIDDTLVRPNGVALSPDERTLYVAISDRAEPEILAYRLDSRGVASDRRRFRDFRAELAADMPGLPDGLKTDAAGNVFATGPGGVHIHASDGTPLGIVATGKAIANCAIGQRDNALFMTSSDMVARVAIKPSTPQP